MVIYEFDTCYEQQTFYREKNPLKVDFTALEGVNGYCDEEAAAHILEVSGRNDSTLAFLGNGNFHYMSYLLLHKIKQDFSLLVLDHHPDMQPSFLEELLSCGCWIKHALEKLPFLREVTVMGVKRELLEELAVTDGFYFCGKEQGVYRYRKEGKNITCIEESFFSGNPHKDKEWCGKLEELLKRSLFHPIYLSVDKDVLAERDCITNWDAGSMTLETMLAVLDFAAKQQPVLGMDVCGEWDGRESTITESPGKIISRNNRCNGKLAEWWDTLRRSE